MQILDGLKEKGVPSLLPSSSSGKSPSFLISRRIPTRYKYFCAIIKLWRGGHMKNMWRISLVLLLSVSAGLAALSCVQNPVQMGMLRGLVVIGPITPVEKPGQYITVPPEVFSSRKILINDANGTRLITEAAITQIMQSAQGYYNVQLEPGTYTIDVTRTGSIGGSPGLPVKITIPPDRTVILNISIDTGIR
jgi:hypothetical protein